MDVRINSYRPATIASTKKVNQTKKIDEKKVEVPKTVKKSDKKNQDLIRVDFKNYKPGVQKIDTYAAYRKRKYAERIKTRFDLFI